MNVLELYSGIGGMHLALNESNVQAKVIAAIDINPVANIVYQHNFSQTPVLNKNIQSLSVDNLNKDKINMILMSPPCQPFTRNGNFGDIDDPRTNSFYYILQILDKLEHLKYILIENVKGFERSKMRQLLIKHLKQACFDYQEFILSPTQFGIPNTRHRYYCIATKVDENTSISLEKQAQTEVPVEIKSLNLEPYEISDILEKSPNKKTYRIPDKDLLKYFKVLDICYANSRRSCCFTKAYGRYLDGTGSVFSECNENSLKERIESLKNETENEYTLKDLGLRYFTPREILRLMCFPETFEFPETVTIKQMYRLLGNSLNVLVVKYLIIYLIKYWRK